MSASQIPNLNTLRRGAGRGRFRNRGGHSGFPSEVGHGSRGAAVKDRVVQGTDNDASVSRLSAVRLGYLADSFADALTPPGSETRRLPIINRGTYVRTTAIDNLVAHFLDGDNLGIRKQIISLGAGSDTRPFRLLSSRRWDDLTYHEIDFPVNAAAKIRAIRSTPSLQRAVGIVQKPGEDNVTISEAGDALHSPSYHIHPLDLRSLAKHPPSSIPAEDTAVLQGVDTKLPTLLISECCLVYLSPIEADSVVNYFTRTLFRPGTVQSDTEHTEKNITAPLGLILYEPIRPDDAFGRTMVSNLATRGIHLQTLNRYASLGAQRKRLNEQGFNGGQAAADVDFIWERWVSENEKERVAGLEMLDEMEEWKLLAQHYCIAWGWREGIGSVASASGVFTGWKNIEGQQDGE
ncbi:carboxy methyl transferase for protein phosphatase 2A [Monascus purpureus]|nr:carboxy methyl transferase for protein phosphatase 2A [Monascus purpureus]